MTYHLTKIHEDGYREFKDAGNMSIALRKNDAGDDECKHDSSPIVDYVIRVGSAYGRTFSAQDWWQTSLVTEILSDQYDPISDSRTVIFNTLNSKYEWKSQ